MDVKTATEGGLSPESPSLDKLKNELLNVYKVRRDEGYTPEYYQVKSDFHEDAESYLSQLGLDEEVAETHAEKVAMEAVIGDVYEALDKVDSWPKIMHMGEEISESYTDGFTYTDGVWIC